MTSKRVIHSALTVAALTASMAASATIATVFNSVPNGTASFDATVTGAGGTVISTVMPSAVGQPSVVTPGFTISHIDSDLITTSTYGSLTGPLTRIDPYGTTRGPAGDSKASGMTFTFNSPVNAFGFEVGDWGTCCWPSALYMSFDGNAPIQVGKSLVDGDVVFNNRYEVFVAAMDDTGSFSSVQFWGDGFGEVLYGGGTIRYALLNQGSLPPPTAVPEPAGLVLAGLVLAGVVLAARRREHG